MIKWQIMIRQFRGINILFSHQQGPVVYVQEWKGTFQFVRQLSQIPCLPTKLEHPSNLQSQKQFYSSELASLWQGGTSCEEKEYQAQPCKMINTATNQNTINIKVTQACLLSFAHDRLESYKSKGFFCASFYSCLVSISSSCNHFFTAKSIWKSKLQP